LDFIQKSPSWAVGLKLPRHPIYADLSCAIWFMPYGVIAEAAKFTKCLTAVRTAQSLLSIPALSCPAGAARVASTKQITNKRIQQNKTMTTKLMPNHVPTSGAKATPAATASISLLHPANPSQAVIAQKAYDIWLARGQKPGCAQKDWFEAEQQLQHT
jgi:hypothetical protein